MRVLFVVLDELMYNHTMFMGTQLELISDHIDKGDEVFILIDNTLRKSFFNPTASLVKLKQSVFKFLNALSFLNLPDSNIIKMKNFKRSKITNIFNNLDELKAFNFNGIDFGEGVASSLISLLKDHEVDTLANDDFIKNLLGHSVFVYDNFVEVVKKIQVNLVYIFNGRLSEQRPIVRVCQQLCIPFMTFEMGNYTFTYNLYENNWVHGVEYFTKMANLSWDAGGVNKKKVAINWFETRKNGNQGRINFTNRQIKSLLPDKFDFSCENVGIFNSSIYEYAAISEMRNPIYKDELEGLKKILDEFRDDKSIKFYLRVHPHLFGFDNSQIRELKKLDYDNLEIIWPESFVDTYELIFACDKILTFGSTVGVEACFWGKPSILIGRAFYEDLDCCYIPKDHQQVVGLINSDLSPKDKLGTLKYAYYNIVRSIPYRKYSPCGESFIGKALNNFDIKNRLYLKMYSFVEKINSFI